MPISIIIGPMKTSLSELPENKQQELKSIVEFLKEKLDLKLLILFGSYARGDWVEDLDEETLQYRYQSDYDLIIITETPYQATKIEENHRLRERMNKIFHRTPVSLIAEDIKFVNRRLGKNQYFYIDIQREGIVLFDSGELELAEPRAEMPPKERAMLAQADFEYWFGSAATYLKYANDAIGNQDNNYAAFNLHQVAERLYSAILLVFSRYKPKSHDLAKLAQRATSFEPQFLKAFPMGTDEQKTRFELLRKAYVDARYKPSFTITLEELAYLHDCVEHLQRLTEQLCKERIESFC